MTHAFSFVDYQPDYLEQAYALFCRSHHAPWSKSSFQDSLESATSVLAIHAGKLLGFILSSYVLDQAEILYIAVDNQHKNKGLGQKMLEIAITKLRCHGVAQICLEVAVDNVPAIALYNKCGFEQISRRKDYYLREGQQTVDAWIMQIHTLSK